MSRYTLTGAFAIAIGVMSLAGCGVVTTWLKPKGPPAPPAPPPMPVTIAVVSSRDIPIYIEQIGKCASPETVAVHPLAYGRIVKVHFTEGKDVKPGDPLFTIDPAPYEAALNQTKADQAMNVAALEQSEATLAQYKAQLEETKIELTQNKLRQDLNLIEYERSKNLLEANAITKQDLDAKTMARDVGAAQLRGTQAMIVRMEAQMKQGDAAITMARSKIKSNDAAIQMAQLNLGYTSVVSPIFGRVGQRMVDEGNVVTTNNTPVLVMIQRMDPMYVDFSVPERELPRVQAGMKTNTLKVECWVKDRAAMRGGDVYFIDNSVQEGTGTIKLRARLKNDDRAFWPGQYVKVRLIFETLKDAPLVPAQATQVGQDGPFVFVVKADETVEMRPIKLGLRYEGDMVAVTDGLKPDEKVVLTGQLMLQPGAKVAPQPVTPPADAKVADATNKEEPKKDESAKKAEEPR